ncbi:MAG: hypothetical protein GOV02_03510 [Candidatus Aenigmarchaeota archaeon]|nr:hypothetical protein [Candidatus Aenigmarchaeota archaeon]
MMAVDKEEGIRYTNAVNFHYSNCLNSCMEHGYAGTLNIPENATPAQTEAIGMWNAKIDKK